jgi:hypothetical protein
MSSATQPRISNIHGFHFVLISPTAIFGLVCPRFLICVQTEKMCGLPTEGATSVGDRALMTSEPVLIHPDGHCSFVFYIQFIFKHVSNVSFVLKEKDFRFSIQPSCLCL